MDMKKICQNQKEEIEKYKWIRGQELNYDPGEAAVKEWVHKHAANYRKSYTRAFNAYIKEVVETINEDIDKNKVDISEEQLQYITKMAIEKFTEIWASDMALKRCKHLDEI